MPAGTSAEPSAGVRDGVEAFAFGTTKTPPNWAGEEQSGVQAALNLPGFCTSDIPGGCAPPSGYGEKGPAVSLLLNCREANIDDPQKMISEHHDLGSFERIV
jgi:hypothetical protein